jgi:hypothetical protein
MRAIEFLLEDYRLLDEGFKNIGGVGVIIHQHSIDQMHEREIPEHIFNILLKKIPSVKNKFKPLEDNHKFYIWSNHLRAGLGLRRRADKDGYMRVIVMTTINRLYDGPEPIFDVR